MCGTQQVVQEEFFKTKLNKNGCKLLCETVIKRSIKELDVGFFESENYLIYQDLTEWKHSKEDYLKVIGLIDSGEIKFEDIDI